MLRTFFGQSKAIYLNEIPWATLAPFSHPPPVLLLLLPLDGSTEPSPWQLRALLNRQGFGSSLFLWLAGMIVVWIAWYAASSSPNARSGSQGEGFPCTQLAGWLAGRSRGWGERGRRGHSAAKKSYTPTPAKEAVPPPLPPSSACLRISLSLREATRRKPPQEAAFLRLETG